MYISLAHTNSIFVLSRNSPAVENCDGQRSAREREKE